VANSVEFVETIMTIDGSYTQAGSGYLIIMQPSERLSISGTATLAGTLVIRGVEEPGPYDLIDWGALVGAFDYVDLLSQAQGVWQWSYFDPEGHFTLWAEIV
jgi:hypothetical protein